MNINWNTKSLIANNDTFYMLFNNLKNLKLKILNYKNKLNNLICYKKFLNLNKEFSSLFSKLSLFISLEKALNIGNIDILAKENELDIFVEQTAKDFAFIDLEQKQFTDDYFEILLSDNSLKEFYRYFNKIKREKLHILSNSEEILLAGASFIDNYEQIYDNLTTTELTFEPVVLTNGRVMKICEHNVSLFKNLKNYIDRKNCSIALLNGYKKHNLSFSTLYLANVKSDNFFAVSRKYKSTFNAKLEASEIDEAVYENLISSVHLALKNFYLYTNFLRKFHNRKLYISDINVQTHHLSKTKYSFEQAVNLVKNALSILGKDYLNIIDYLIENNRIDAFPKKGKTNGAFSADDGNGNIYVLLNFVNDFYSVQTFAHELGHAIHSYYSDLNQPYSLRNYDIFVAEIASTVNEILLIDFMISNANSKKQKLAYIEMLISLANSTIFRQTMFAEFEYWTHSSINKNVPLTYNDLNNKYLNLLKLYFGNNVKILQEYKFEWSRIPHFYHSFYVYKYATGLLAAMLIVKKIKNSTDFLPKYIEFLSSGASLDPVSLLAKLGIDFKNINTFVEAFDIYASWVDELQRS